ncbi:o-antigen polymerase [Sulfurifustis variabilis]|uniref:O-antigen polymerase n=1 Tax=Sulfurifustis variabilis TaxID=1675686 RepID=A0A1B4VDG3_9GAMM|nr:O-antigen ligase family protein [Sulfurifustis variabilis]BAU47917.1 o-antigen polymerase [Sulfurifustis variabilis]
MPSTNDSPFETFPAPEGSEDSARERTVEWAGKPLRSTLLFLSVPAAFAVVIRLFNLQLPSVVLYGLAAALGLALVKRSMSDPEWLFAAFVVYIPLNKVYVAPIVPGVNATNAFLILLILTWIVRSVREERPMFVTMPGSKLVGAWALLTMFSGVTVIFTLGSYVLVDQLQEYKAWVDQFIVFFAFLNLIRDGAMARRLVVYTMLGSVVVVLFGVQEMLDKQGAPTIELSRLFGPHNQPNDFGAFLVYAAAPFIALFLAQMPRIRSWVLVPYFLVVAKLLLTTFSRGAYVAMAFGGLVAGYLRGKLFLFSWLIVALLLLWSMPELIPESLVERMSHTTVEGGHRQELDASSQTRLVLWNAAIEMSLESPLLGKGFKAFPVLKSGYTEFEVHESDNHNMYLYISSQMGIPALLLFVLILYRAYRLGARVYRESRDTMARVAGMATATIVAAVVLVNMFGSRMVSLDVTAYVWIYLAVVAHLWIEVEKRREAKAAEEEAEHAAA